MIKGVDYTGAGIGFGAKLKAAGYGFAMRYTVPDTYSKHLTLAEANDICGAGVRLGSNFESWANRALDGKAAGQDDAKQALMAATNCGMPPGKPIYFSVDFDVTANQIGAVLDYLDGASGVLGAQSVGVYGGKNIIQAAKSHNSSWYLWQTFAWSGGYWVPGVDIRQVGGTTVGGLRVDVDEAYTEAGLWLIGEDDTMTDDEVLAALGRKLGMSPDTLHDRLLMAAGYGDVADGDLTDPTNANRKLGSDLAKKIGEGPGPHSHSVTGTAA